MTVAENYVPIGLLAACMGLYLAYAPFAENFSYYMATKDPIYSFQGLAFNSVPLSQWAFGPYLSSRVPFQDYVAYALSGIALLSVVPLLSRWRKASTISLPATAPVEFQSNKVNLSLCLLTVLTASFSLALVVPWWAAFIVQLFVVLLAGGTIALTWSYGMQKPVKPVNPWRARLMGAGAYLLLLIAAIVSGIFGALLAETAQRRPKPGTQDWALLLGLLPLVVAGILGAVRKPFRVPTSVIFALVSLGITLFLISISK